MAEGGGDVKASGSCTQASVDDADGARVPQPAATRSTKFN
jgi:hypothetical protein